MKKAYIISLLLSITIGSCQKIDEMAGWKVEYFKGTPVYELAAAIKNDDLKQVEKLLRQKAFDINTRDNNYGNTVLTYATVYSKNEAIKMLLENGADPNLADTRYNETALILAVKNTRNNSGESYDNCNTEIIELMIKYGGNVNTKQQFNYTSTNGGAVSANTSLLGIASQNGCLNVVKLLVEHGADINFGTESEPNHIILSALYQNNLDIVKYLIVDKKAKVSPVLFTRPANGTTPAQNVSIESYLTDQDYVKDSDEFNLRQEIIDYLQNK